MVQPWLGPREGRRDDLPPPPPRSLRTPDWERLRDITVMVCRDCGKVLEIRFNSQPWKIPEGPKGVPKEARLETIY